MYTESVDLFEGVATEPEETKRSCKRGRSDNACIQAWLQAWLQACGCGSLQACGCGWL